MSSHSGAATGWSQDEIRRRISELGEWFHNLDLNGVQTAPNHFLGDYPSCKWQRFADAIPADLRGRTVLDIGCNAGFPLDWNHWTIHEWPEKLEEIRAVTDLPVWISEVGASTFGAEEIQQFGLRRAAELLIGRAERIHWYSLFDLPREWPATTRHREAEGSSYYRHFYMGLLRQDGTPKLALQDFADYTPDIGICQWFHFNDHRLDRAVRWLRDLGVRHLRTGLSWADSFRPGAEQWFDRQMKALEPFDTTLTYCFTPEHCGVTANYTSPPKNVEQFADFCSAMTRRYA